MGDHLRCVADSRASHIETFTHEKENTLNFVSKSPSFLALLSTDENSGDYPEIVGEVASARAALISAYPEIADLCVRGKTGEPLPGDSGDCGFSLRDHKEYADGKRKTHIGDVRANRHSGYTITFAKPVVDEGEFLGTVSIETDAEAFFAIVGDVTGFGNTGEAYVINSEGRMMTPGRFETQFDLMKNVDTESSRACLELVSEGRETLGETPVFVFPDYRGVRVMGTYVSMPEQGWCVMAEIDEAEALIAPAEGLYGMAIFIGVILILLLAILGIVFGGQLSKPLLGLTEKVDQISKGNLDISLGKSRIDEVQNLTDSLDRILASLKLAVIKTGLSKEDLELGQALAARKEAEKKARIYFDLARVMMVVLDRAGNVEMINQKGAEIVGYAREEILGKDWFSFAPEEDRKRLTGMHRKVVHGKMENIESFDNDILAKDGTRRTIRWHNTVLKDNSGRITGTLSSGEDITEQSRAQEALKESEEKMRALFVNIPDAIYMLDGKGFFLDGNRSAEELVGYRKADLIGKNFAEVNLLPRNQVAKALSLLAKNLQGKPTGPDEFSLKRKDGTERIIELYTYPVRLRGKKVVLGAARDITERKRANEALKESEERLKLMFESAPDPFYMFDLKFNLIDANSAAERLSGYAKEEVIGKNLFTRLLPPQEIPKATKIVRQFISGNTGKPFDLTIKTKEGKLVPVEVSAFPVKIRGKTYMFGIARDVSERRRAEEAIRKSEEKLKLLFESAPDPFFMMDLQGTLIDANKAAEEIAGYRKEELLGKNIIRTVVSPEDRAKAIKLAAETALGRGSLTEIAIVRKDGSRVSVEISGNPIKLRGQNFIFGIMRDISERKRARQEIDSKVRELSTLYEVITAANKAKDLDSMLSEILDASLKLTGFDSGGVYLLDEEKEIAELRFGRNISKPALVKTIVANGKPRHKQVLIDGRPLFVEDYSAIDAQLAKRLGISALASIPLRTKDGVIGAINIAGKKPRKFTEGERELLCLIGKEAGTAVARMLAEEKVEKSEQRYRMIADNITDFVITMDFSGKWTYISPSHSLLGYRPEELLGKNAFDYVHPDDRKKLIPQFQKYAKYKIEELLKLRAGKGPIRAEYRFRNKEGQWRDIEAYASLVEVPEAGHQVLIVSRDVTGRKETTRKTSESERKFREVFDNQPNYCYMVSPEGKITDVNKAALGALGYKKEDLVGKPMKKIYAPESLGKVKALFGRRKQSGKIENEELAILAKTGEKRIVLLSTAAVKDAQGKALYSISVQRDITDIEEAEVEREAVLGGDEEGA